MHTDVTLADTNRQLHTIESIFNASSYSSQSESHLDNKYAF